MSFKQTLFTLLSLSSLATAHPLLNTFTTRAIAVNDAMTTIMTNVIQTISPATSTCDHAPHPEECSTAQHAAPFLLHSFNDYDLMTIGEIIAVTSLMLFESGDLKYNKNYFSPSGGPNPGQGTRNMQQASFNSLYAAYLVSQGRLSEEALSAATTPDAVLALVQPDEFTFGSAAWFLATQCSAEIRTGLQSAEGGREAAQAAWEAYLTECVGVVPVTDERREGWMKAYTAVTGQSA